MSFPWDEAMTEAFRRAQMRGRVVPQVCDFPPSVPKEKVELHYLAPLRVLTDAANNTGKRASLPAVQYGPIEHTTFSACDEEATFLTSGGDAWAAVVAVLNEGVAEE